MMANSTSPLAQDMWNSSVNPALSPLLSSNASQAAIDHRASNSSGNSSHNNNPSANRATAAGAAAVAGASPPPVNVENLYPFGFHHGEDGIAARRSVLHPSAHSSAETYSFSNPAPPPLRPTLTTSNQQQLQLQQQSSPSLSTSASLSGQRCGPHDASTQEPPTVADLRGRRVGSASSRVAAAAAAVASSSPALRPGSSSYASVSHTHLHSHHSRNNSNQLHHNAVLRDLASCASAGSHTSAESQKRMKSRQPSPQLRVRAAQRPTSNPDHSGGGAGGAIDVGTSPSFENLDCTSPQLLSPYLNSLLLGNGTDSNEGSRYSTGVRAATTAATATATSGVFSSVRHTRGVGAAPTTTTTTAVNTRPGSNRYISDSGEPSSLPPHSSDPQRSSVVLHQHNHHHHRRQTEQPHTRSKSTNVDNISSSSNKEGDSYFLYNATSDSCRHSEAATPVPLSEPQNASTNLSAASPASATTEVENAKRETPKNCGLHPFSSLSSAPAAVSVHRDEASQTQNTQAESEHPRQGERRGTLAYQTQNSPLHVSSDHQTSDVAEVLTEKTHEKVDAQLKNEKACASEEQTVKASRVEVEADGDDGDALYSALNPSLAEVLPSPHHSDDATAPHRVQLPVTLPIAEKSTTSTKVDDTGGGSGGSGGRPNYSSSSNYASSKTGLPMSNSNTNNNTSSNKANGSATSTRSREDGLTTSSPHISKNTFSTASGSTTVNTAATVPLNTSATAHPQQQPLPPSQTRRQLRRYDLPPLSAAAVRKPATANAATHAPTSATVNAATTAATTAVAPLTSFTASHNTPTPTKVALPSVLPAERHRYDGSTNDGSQLSGLVSHPSQSQSQSQSGSGSATHTPISNASKNSTLMKRSRMSSALRLNLRCFQPTSPSKQLTPKQHQQQQQQQHKASPPRGRVAALRHHQQQQQQSSHAAHPPVLHGPTLQPSNNASLLSPDSDATAASMLNNTVSLLRGASTTTATNTTTNTTTATPRERLSTTVTTTTVMETPASPSIATATPKGRRNTAKPGDANSNAASAAVTATTANAHGTTRRFILRRAAQRGGVATGGTSGPHPQAQDNTSTAAATAAAAAAVRGDSSENKDSHEKSTSLSLNTGTTTATNTANTTQQLQEGSLLSRTNKSASAPSSVSATVASPLFLSAETPVRRRRLAHERGAASSSSPLTSMATATNAAAAAEGLTRVSHSPAIPALRFQPNSTAAPATGGLSPGKEVASTASVNTPLLSARSGASTASTTRSGTRVPTTKRRLRAKALVRSQRASELRSSHGSPLNGSTTSSFGSAMPQRATAVVASVPSLSLSLSQQSQPVVTARAHPGRSLTSASMTFSISALTAGAVGGFPNLSGLAAATAAAGTGGTAAAAAAHGGSILNASGSRVYGGGQQLVTPRPRETSLQASASSLLQHAAPTSPIVVFMSGNGMEDGVTRVTAVPSTNGGSGGSGGGGGGAGSRQPIASTRTSRPRFLPRFSRQMRSMRRPPTSAAVAGAVGESLEKSSHSSGSLRQQRAQQQQQQQRSAEELGSSKGTLHDGGYSLGLRDLGDELQDSVKLTSPIKAADSAAAAAATAIVASGARALTRQAGSSPSFTTILIENDKASAGGVVAAGAACALLSDTVSSATIMNSTPSVLLQVRSTSTQRGHSSLSHATDDDDDDNKEVGEGSRKRVKNLADITGASENRTTTGYTTSVETPKVVMRESDPGARRGGEQNNGNSHNHASASSAEQSEEDVPAPPEDHRPVSVSMEEVTCRRPTRPKLAVASQNALRAATPQADAPKTLEEELLLEDSQRQRQQQESAGSEASIAIKQDASSFLKGNEVGVDDRKELSLTPTIACPLPAPMVAAVASAATALTSSSYASPPDLEGTLLVTKRESETKAAAEGSSETPLVKGREDAVTTAQAAAAATDIVVVAAPPATGVEATTVAVVVEEVVHQPTVKTPTSARKAHHHKTIVEPVREDSQGRYDHCADAEDEDNANTDARERKSTVLQTHQPEAQASLPKNTPPPAQSFADRHHDDRTCTPHLSPLPPRPQASKKMRRGNNSDHNDDASFLCAAVPSINEEEAHRLDFAAASAKAVVSDLTDSSSTMQNAAATADYATTNTITASTGTASATQQDARTVTTVSVSGSEARRGVTAAAAAASVGALPPVGATALSGNGKSHFCVPHLSRDVVEEAAQVQTSVSPSRDATILTYTTLTGTVSASSASAPTDPVFSSADSFNRVQQQQQLQPHHPLPPHPPHPTTTTITNAAAVTKTPTATVCYQRSALYSFFATGRSGSVVMTAPLPSPMALTPGATAVGTSSFYNTVVAAPVTASSTTTPFNTGTPNLGPSPLYACDPSTNEFVTASLNGGSGSGSSAVAAAAATLRSTSSPITRLTTLLFTYSSANASAGAAAATAAAAPTAQGLNEDAAAVVGSGSSTTSGGGNHRSLTHPTRQAGLWPTRPPAPAQMRCASSVLTPNTAAEPSIHQTSMPTPSRAVTPAAASTVTTTTTTTATNTAAAVTTMRETASSTEDVVVGLKSVDKASVVQLTSPVQPLESLSPQLPPPAQRNDGLPPQQQSVFQQRASNTFSFFPPRTPLLQPSILMAVSPSAVYAASLNSSLRPLAKRKWTSAVTPEAHPSTLSRRSSLFHSSRKMEVASTEAQKESAAGGAGGAAAEEGPSQRAVEKESNTQRASTAPSTILVRADEVEAFGGSVAANGTTTSTAEMPPLPILDQDEIGQLWKEVCASTPKNGDRQRHGQPSRRRSLLTRQRLQSANPTAVYESTKNNNNTTNINSNSPPRSAPHRQSRRRSPLWSGSHRSSTPNAHAAAAAAMLMVGATNSTGGDVSRVDFSDRTSSSSGTGGTNNNNTYSRDPTHLSFPSIVALMNSDDDDDAASADRHVREELAFLEYDPDVEEILRARAEVMRRSGRRPSASRLPMRRASAHFTYEQIHAGNNGIMEGNNHVNKNNNNGCGEAVVKPCLQPTSSFARRRRGAERRPHSSSSASASAVRHVRYGSGGTSGELRSDGTNEDNDDDAAAGVSANNKNINGGMTTATLREFSGAVSQLRRAHSSANKSAAMCAEEVQQDMSPAQQPQQVRRYPWHSPTLSLQSALLLSTDGGSESDDDSVDTFTSHSRTANTSHHHHNHNNNNGNTQPAPAALTTAATTTTSATSTAGDALRERAAAPANGSGIMRSGAHFRGTNSNAAAATITSTTTTPAAGSGLKARTSLTNHANNVSKETEAADKYPREPRGATPHVAVHGLESMDPDVQEQQEHQKGVASHRTQLKPRRHRPWPSILLSGTDDDHNGSSSASAPSDLQRNAEHDSDGEVSSEEEEKQTDVPLLTGIAGQPAHNLTPTAAAATGSGTAAARATRNGGRQRRASVTEPEDGGISPVLSLLTQAKSRPAPLVADTLHLPASTAATNHKASRANTDTSNDQQQQEREQQEQTQQQQQGEGQDALTAVAATPLAAGAASPTNTNTTANSPVTGTNTAVPTPFSLRPSPATPQRTLENLLGRTNSGAVGPTATAMTAVAAGGPRSSDESPKFARRPLHTALMADGQKDETGSERDAAEAGVPERTSSGRRRSSGVNNHNNHTSTKPDAPRLRSVLSESLTTVKSDAAPASASGPADHAGPPQHETAANVSFVYHPLTLDELAVHNATPLLGNGISRSNFTIRSGFNSALVSNAESRFAEAVRDGRGPRDGDAAAAAATTTAEEKEELLAVVVTDPQQPSSSVRKSRGGTRRSTNSDQPLTELTAVNSGSGGGDAPPVVQTTQVRSERVSVNGPLKASPLATPPLPDQQRTGATDDESSLTGVNSTSDKDSAPLETKPRFGKSARTLSTIPPVVSLPEDDDSDHSSSDDDRNDGNANADGVRDDGFDSDTSSTDLSTAQLQPWTSPFALGPNFVFHGQAQQNSASGNDHHFHDGSKLTSGSSRRRSPAGMLPPANPDRASPSAGPSILLPSRKYQGGSSILTTPTPAPYVLLNAPSDGSRHNNGANSAAIPSSTTTATTAGVVGGCTDADESADTVSMLALTLDANPATSHGSPAHPSTTAAARLSGSAPSGVLPPSSPESFGQRRVIRRTRTSFTTLPEGEVAAGRERLLDDTAPLPLSPHPPSSPQPTSQQASPRPPIAAALSNVHLSPSGRRSGAFHSVTKEAYAGHPHFHGANYHNSGNDNIGSGNTNPHGSGLVGGTWGEEKPCSPSSSSSHNLLRGSVTSPTTATATPSGALPSATAVPAFVTMAFTASPDSVRPQLPPPPSSHRQHVSFCDDVDGQDIFCLPPRFVSSEGNVAFGSSAAAAAAGPSASPRPSAMYGRGSLSGVASVSPVTSPAGGSVLVLPHPPPLSVSPNPAASPVATTVPSPASAAPATEHVASPALLQPHKYGHSANVVNTTNPHNSSSNNTSSRTYTHNDSSGNSASSAQQSSNSESQNPPHEVRCDAVRDGEVATVTPQRPTWSRQPQSLTNGLGAALDSSRYRPHNNSISGQQNNNSSSGSGVNDQQQQHHHIRSGSVHGLESSLSPAAAILNAHALHPLSSPSKPYSLPAPAHTHLFARDAGTVERRAEGSGGENSSSRGASNSSCNANNNTYTYNSIGGAVGVAAATSEKGLQGHQLPFASRRSGTRGSTASGRSGSAGRARNYDWAGSMVGSVATMESNSFLSSPTDSEL